jgi:hypothetical protein
MHSQWYRPREREELAELERKEQKPRREQHSPKSVSNAKAEQSITAKRLGLLNRARLLTGFRRINFFLSSCGSLSIPRVPGWLVSGKKKYMQRNIRNPARARVYCITRHDA